MYRIIALLVVAVAALPELAAAQVRASSPGGAEPLAIGETFTIESRILGEERRINVFLPTVYGTPPDGPTPVLYMPDGGIYEDFLHIAGLLQVLVSNGTMRPFLLVGIENTFRRRDLTGPTENAEDRTIAPEVGGSAKFRQFIRTELVPAIRERYATTGESAIVGESLAGLFVVETFLVEPDLFDTYIAIDPSLWWNDGKLVEAAAHRARLAAGRSLFLASSDQPEIAELTRRLAEVLDAHAPAELRWRYEALAEESHATIYHPAAMRAFRQLLAP